MEQLDGGASAVASSLARPNAARDAALKSTGTSIRLMLLAIVCLLEGLHSGSHLHIMAIVAPHRFLLDARLVGFDGFHGQVPLPTDVARRQAEAKEREHLGFRSTWLEGAEGHECVWRRNLGYLRGCSPVGVGSTG